MRARVPALLLVATLAAPVAAPALAGPGPDEVVERAPDAEDVLAVLSAAGRETEPVVLTGDAFAGWAVPADVPVKANSTDGAECLTGTSDDACSHNAYEEPDASSQDVLGLEGVPVDRLIGYRWGGERFEQVPFQVDEVFVRFLSNDISGFAAYSETDQHTSYAFDREGFRWMEASDVSSCVATYAPPAPDPVPGLDTDDELVFLARDTGPQAPATAPVPAGLEDLREVAVTDPMSGSRSYLYVALASETGPRPAFDASNGYVRYERDAEADVFRFSESSYDNYGAAPAGAYRDEATGECRADGDDAYPPLQRRPGDQATVTTPRYRFRYEGRWLMTELRVDPTDDGAAIVPDPAQVYADDLVDQWKARAFQQRPGGETPCCGYEEEVNNWGGSSQLMGERSGPVRTIRETWGADSGTNVVRREVFYRDEVQQTSFLRVHMIPPGDGIYVQWDHNALAIDTYRNPYVPDGVPVDGVNDEVFGNSRIYLGQSGVGYSGDDPVSDAVEDLYTGTPLEPWLHTDRDGCDNCVYNDIDSPDPTFQGPNGLLAWEQVSGPTATLVTRWSTQPGDVTPGGLAHAPLTVPYYRDDAGFDDGTGSDPGPHLNARDVDPGCENEPRTREIWSPEDGPDGLGTDRYCQGSIGTHGLHILAIADSDNAHTTLPITEMISTNRIVVLPGDQGNVGERYGRGFEKPLVVTVMPRTGIGLPPGGDGEPDAAWLAGDLHVHTTYSHDSYGGPDDGDTGPDEAYTLGNSVTEQFAVAAARGLDFLAITDHNDVRSQSDPGFGSNGVLGVPGYEKSLSGHAQMLGAGHVYETGARDAADVNRIADALRSDGGVFQINHPAEGTTARPDQDGHTDHEHLDWGYGHDVVPDTIEVWNIAPYWQPPMPSASSLDAAIRFWEEFLDAGHRVGATGGSDNHYKATLAVQGPGQPTTSVLADDRSVDGVLAGLRAGRTFVSWQPPALGGPRLYLEADTDRDGDFETPVGGETTADGGLRVRVEGAPVGSEVRVFVDGGRRHASEAIDAPTDVVVVPMPTDATWIRADLVLDGALVGDEPPYAPLTTVCDEQVGDNPVHPDGDTTYCRNQVGLLALTSPLYVAAPDEVVEPVATTLTWVGDEQGRGATIDAAAQLLDADGAPVMGRTVVFASPQDRAAGVTGADGVARATLDASDHGRSVTVTATFAGDDAYLPSSTDAQVTWGNSQGGHATGAAGRAGTVGTAAAVPAAVRGGATALVIVVLVLAATALARGRHRTT